MESGFLSSLNMGQQLFFFALKIINTNIVKLIGIKETIRQPNSSTGIEYVVFIWHLSNELQHIVQDSQSIGDASKNDGSPQSVIYALILVLSTRLKVGAVPVRWF